MPEHLKLRLVAAGGVIAGAMLVACAATGSLAAQDLLLQGGSVVDVRTGTVAEASVLVRDGVVRQIAPNLAPPAGATVLDVSGRWIIPGLVEAHNHATDSVALRRALGLGVTSVLTVYTGELTVPSPIWEATSHLPRHPGPRTYIIGGRFRMPFAIGSGGMLNPATVEEVGAALDTLRTQGVTRIKIWLDDGAVQFDSTMPTFDDRIFGALIDGARARGMQAFVHAISGALYRRAVGARPTWIIHPMVSDSLTLADVSAIRAAGLGYTSTLSVVERNADARRYSRRALADPRIVAGMTARRLAQYRREVTLAENPRAATRPRIVRRGDDYLHMIRRGLHLVVQNDLTLAVGSDVDAGYGTHVEMELLQDAGLTPATVLRAATLGGANALGVVGRFGAIEAGLVADLVVLTSNPLEDVRNLRDVQYVVKGGFVWTAAELIGPPDPAPG